VLDQGIRELIAETVAEVVRQNVRPLPDILTPEEAAEYLRLSRSHLTNLRVTGRGPKFVRAGKLIRYRREDLLAWCGEPQEPGHA